MRQQRAEQASEDATRHVAALTAILIATALAFGPLLDNGFVNWDDPFTIQGNPHLAAPVIVTWAFTTHDMGHYQPVAWLVWSQTKTLFGLALAQRTDHRGLPCRQHRRRRQQRTEWHLLRARARRERRRE
jgi:hypothetical protein